MWDGPSLGVLPARDNETELSWTQSVVLAGKRGQFPLVGNAPSPSLKQLLLVSVSAGVYSMHAKVVNHCLKAIVKENRYYLQITIEETQRPASGQGLLDVLKPEGC